MKYRKPVLTDLTKIKLNDYSRCFNMALREMDELRWYRAALGGSLKNSFRIERQKESGWWRRQALTCLRVSRYNEKREESSI